MRERGARMKYRLLKAKSYTTQLFETPPPYRFKLDRGDSLLLGLGRSLKNLMAIIKFMQKVLEMHIQL